jgi:uncharacterized cupin superfamily protein
LGDYPCTPGHTHARREDHVAGHINGRLAHCFVNRGTKDCRTLTIGERKRGIDRVFYPEDPEHDASSRTSIPSGTGRRRWQSSRRRGRNDGVGANREGPEALDARRRRMKAKT